MTRARAQQYVRTMLTGFHKDSTHNHYKDVSTAINKIYDDFESCSCENCEYFHEDVCTNDECPLCADFVDKDFGCNKFVRKESR